jgi:hypothetical protein
VVSLFKEDPVQWEGMVEYKRARAKVNGLKVINDCAERAIALMTQYNDSLAKDEEKKRKILQVVENNRKRVKSTSKNALQHYKTV